MFQMVTSLGKESVLFPSQRNVCCALLNVVQRKKLQNLIPQHNNSDTTGRSQYSSFKANILNRSSVKRKKKFPFPCATPCPWSLFFPCYCFYIAFKTRRFMPKLTSGLSSLRVAVFLLLVTLGPGLNDVLGFFFRHKSLCSRNVLLRHNSGEHTNSS